jgi:hypothetical protein
VKGEKNVTSLKGKYQGGKHEKGLVINHRSRNNAGGTGISRL